MDGLVCFSHDSHRQYIDASASRAEHREEVEDQKV